MDKTNPEDPLEVEKFRSYLRVLAKVNMPRKLRTKLDASDLVQQTLLQAHRDRDQFRGNTVEERCAWLREILRNNLANAYRHFEADKRDIAREQSLDASLGRSSTRLFDWLAAEQSTPSGKLMKQERFLKLLEVLEELPEDHQQVLLLHYCEGLPLAEIGEMMGREAGALAALAYRALKKLRERMVKLEI